jgi:hypothetical protein
MHIKNTQDADKIAEHNKRQFFEKRLMLSPEEAQVIEKVRFRPSKTWS